ncbi:heat shock protein 90 [Moniliophthora roreri]|nr:heat shock protein 90 [Moniliophthora roreri]
MNDTIDHEWYCDGVVASGKGDLLMVYLDALVIIPDAYLYNQAVRGLSMKLLKLNRVHKQWSAKNHLNETRRPPRNIARNYFCASRFSHEVHENERADRVPDRFNSAKRYFGLTAVVGVDAALSMYLNYQRSNTNPIHTIHVKD